MIVTIFVRLINEGTDALRSTQAIQLEDGLFKLLPTPNYDPEDEKWEFKPGSTVGVIEHKGTEGKYLVAIKSAQAKEGIVREDSSRIAELQKIFSDQLNYANAPTSPIDPRTYKTPEGDSCLHIAAVRGDNRAIELLLDLGLDVNSQGDMGNTALHYAKTHGNKDAYALLVARGASPNIVNEFGVLSGEPPVQ